MSQVSFLRSKKLSTTLKTFHKAEKIKTAPNQAKGLFYRIKGKKAFWCSANKFHNVVPYILLVGHKVFRIWIIINLRSFDAKFQYKHRKNCECCHHHSLFKGHNVIVHIVVLNCQKCNQCLKCHVSGHKNFQKLWKLPKNLKTLKNCQKLSTLSKLSKMSKIVKYYQKLPKIVQIVKKW